MEEKAAVFHTVINAVQALGRGFDVNYDTRLLYCKGVGGSRVVEINEEHKRDLWLYDDILLPNVSKDITNFQEPGGRDSTSVCSYNEVCTIPCFICIYWLLYFEFQLTQIICLSILWMTNQNLKWTAFMVEKIIIQRSKKPNLFRIWYFKFMSSYSL